MADFLTAVLSKDIGKNPPLGEYAAALASFGLPQAFADILADSDAGAAKGALLDDGRQLSTLIGIRPDRWQIPLP